MLDCKQKSIHFERSVHALVRRSQHQLLEILLAFCIVEIDIVDMLPFK
jgi:hypothetical protein